MTVESWRGYVAPTTAAILALLAVLLAFVAWQQPIDAANPRDLAILFGFLGTVFGASSGFLFAIEAGNQASRSTERAFGGGQPDTGAPWVSTSSTEGTR